MKKYINFFLILYLINSILSEENETSTDINNETDINSNNEALTNELYKSLENVNVTDEEVDKLLFCGALLQLKIGKEEKAMDELANELNSKSKEEILDKVGSYLIKKCFNSVELKIARKYFNGGLYMNVIDEEKYEYYKSYHEIDYSIFKNKKKEDLIQDEDVDLILKFHKAFQIHNKKQEEIERNADNFKEEKKTKDKKTKENIKRKINVDLPNIPTYFKVIIFVVVFGIVFGGILYYVNSINRKLNKEKKDKKDKKDRKKKKKNE